MVILSILLGYYRSYYRSCYRIHKSVSRPTKQQCYTGLCPYSSSPPATGSAAEMDPTIAAEFHNLTCSLLCRLPEELLLDIMKHLDITGIQCLRRACRLFLRLYSSPIFSSSYLGNKDEILQLEHHQYWHQPKHKPHDSWPKKLTALLHKDHAGYCEGCQRQRMHPSWTSKKIALTANYLHCSGCDIDHPVCLFSRAQRRKSPRSRICIGREGCIRACEHLTISWKKIISIAVQVAKLDIDTPAEISLSECRHVSHFPAHHKKDTSLINRQPINPTIELRGSRNFSIFIILRWTGHLRLPDLGFDEYGYNQIATPSQMRQQIRQFRQGGAEFIAPEFSPGHMLEMNCFDQNRCFCLRHDGIEQLPKGRKLAPDKEASFLPHTTRESCLEEASNNECRIHPSYRLEPLRLFGPDEQDISSEQQRLETHLTSVRTPGEGSKLDIRVQPCAGDSRCLQMRYTRRITLSAHYTTPGPKRPIIMGSVWLEWCQAMDPESYNLTDDKESFEILWCRQANCKNYYKYLKKAPFPAGETNRACSRSCPSEWVIWEGSPYSYL